MAGYKQLYELEKAKLDQANETIFFMVDRLQGRPFPVNRGKTADRYLQNMSRAEKMQNAEKEMENILNDGESQTAAGADKPGGMG